MIESLLERSADILPFIAVGFGAQMIDGALGMAFGVMSNTLLLTLGVPPAAASAGVHMVEAFTTGVSGISHVLHRNVDGKMFARLLIPGLIGGVSGAYLLSNIDGSLIKPYILAYLVSIGLWLIWRGIVYPPQHRRPKLVEPLGLVGGFLDASGGGGWGPIVTSNLLIQGSHPRVTIGTVNAVEFFLTLTISLTFFLSLGAETFTKATVGLLLGGVIAAPFGAKLARHVAPRTLLLAVGAILTATSLFGLSSILGFIG